MGLEVSIQSLREHGIAICKNENHESWSKFKQIIDSSISDFLEKSKNNDVDPSELNSLRLESYSALNAMEGWDTSYYSMAASLLSAIFGSDLLIQRKLNLSIQMPGDKSSLLGMHTDTLSGQSPFEFVMWTAFTKAFDTNSMFYFDREVSKEIFYEMAENEMEGLEALRKKYWAKAKFVDAEASDVVIFSGTLFHGNVLNKTQDSRISINCRFKNLFSPSGKTNSADRGAGIFYKLFSESVATEIGREYLSRDLNFDL
jgi:sporadic carbohydrate cluster 2OG-Fe(II) oxygenase